jgi:hypothetical protein
LCAQVTDLPVCARHARPQVVHLVPATCGMRYRYLLGVKCADRLHNNRRMIRFLASPVCPQAAVRERHF